MIVLGVDYGKVKIGLAIAEGFLAQPLRVIRVFSLENAVVEVVQAVRVEQAEQVVVGVSEGKMGQEQREFTNKLRQGIDAPVVVWDETLTTQDAQALARQAEVGRKKRRGMEDAFAAAVMLQSYLDCSSEDRQV